MSQILSLFVFLAIFSAGLLLGMFISDYSWMNAFNEPIVCSSLDSVELCNSKLLHNELISSYYEKLNR